MRPNPATITMRPVHFGEGKARLYADFDGTYFPGHIKECQESEEKRADFKRYFGTISDFLRKAGDSIRFTLTTGRSLSSFQDAQRKLREAGIDMRLPKALIVNDGSDEFSRVEEVPPDAMRDDAFSWETLDTFRQERLADLADWNPDVVRQRVRTFLQRQGIAYRETSKNPVLNRGLAPLESWGDSPSQAKLEREGAFQLSLSVPKKAVDDVARFPSQFTRAVGHRLHVSFLEKSGDQFKFRIRPFVEGKKLGKSHDTIRAVDAAQLQDDLVLVAGNGHNDLDMLDPATYLPVFKRWETMPARLKPAIEQTPYLQDCLKKLPLMGIVVRDPEHPEPKLERLIQAYGEGPWRKIIPVEKGDLLNGIQQAIREYRVQNPQFQRKLDPQLREALGDPLPYRRQVLHTMGTMVSILHTGMRTLHSGFRAGFDYSLIWLRSFLGRPGWRLLPDAENAASR